MIWFLRHGDAEPHGGDDAARELTEKGRKQARWAGEALAVMGWEIEICLTSPKVRAADTAKIACEVLGMEPEVEERLRGGPFEAEAIADGRDALLVGHEPDFSTAINALTGAGVKLKKGGLASCEPGILHGLYRPKDLKLIGRS